MIIGTHAQLVQLPLFIITNVCTEMEDLGYFLAMIRLFSFSSSEPRNAFQIFTYIEPIDLLHLSRANKRIRSILTSKVGVSSFILF